MFTFPSSINRFCTPDPTPKRRAPQPQLAYGYLDAYRLDMLTLCPTPRLMEMAGPNHDVRLYMKIEE